MRIKKDFLNQEGLTLIEVLASIVIITLLLSIAGSLLINNMNNTKAISNKYHATQLAQSLLDTYIAKPDAELLALVNKTANINIKNELRLDPGADIGQFTAKVGIAKHVGFEDRLLDITITVISSRSGVTNETVLKGYKRYEAVK